MGTVYQQRSTGKWYASVLIDGRRVTRHAKNEKLAKQMLTELEAHKMAGQAPPVAKTVGELLERWIEAEKPRWKPKTLHEYRRLVTKVILPGMGSARLNKLPADRVQRFIDGIDGSKQRLNVFRLLHRSFVVATRWGWIATNPMDRIEPPRYRSLRPQLATIDQLKGFLAVIEGHPWEPWITVAVYSGIRPGEQAALRWSDVDINAGTIRIERAGQHLNRKWTETDPKSISGTRTILLPNRAVEALQRQGQLVAKRRSKTQSWQDLNLVFPGRQGQPLAQNTVGKALKRLLHHHGIQGVSPHKLRHVCASILLSHGVPLPVVSRRLGHANVHITATTYAHAVNSDSEAAVALRQVLED